MLVADVGKRGSDTVEERLGANEAVVGKHVGRSARCSPEPKPISK